MNFDYCCATADANVAYAEVTKNAYCKNRVVSKYASDVGACAAAVNADPACGNDFSFYGGANSDQTKYCDCPPPGDACVAENINTGAPPNIYTVYTLTSKGANANSDRQSRSSSCKDDNHHKCPNPPCSDYGSKCPSDFPYAYRPTVNFDYCCATGDGNGAGEEGMNANPDRQSRSSSCKDDRYYACPNPPCADHGGLWTYCHWHERYLNRG